MRNVLKFRSETGIVYGIKFVLQNKTSQPLPNNKKKFINLDFFVSIVHFPCSFQTIQKNKYRHLVDHQSISPTQGIVKMS